MKAPFTFMPTLIEQLEIKIKWTDIEGRVFKEKLGSDKRSTGVHLSGIIRYCMDLSSREEQDNEVMPLNMAFGLAWEAWAVGLFPAVIWQPGEEELDGVFGTADGLSQLKIDGKYVDVVEEWKATWKGSSKYGNVLAQKLWMWQLCGLCKLNGVRHARIHILWINGNYKPPTPKYATYLIEFTQQELDDFWNKVILPNRDKATPESHE